MGEINNVAVFIDYENVYRTLLIQKKNILRCGFLEKLRVYFQDKGRRIVKIALYCNFDIDDLYTSHHQSILQSYGVETVHTSNQGKNYADMQITIDVLNSMYLNNNIDEFVIISNDKDMIPLLNAVRANKRKVTVVTIGDKYNPSIKYFADDQISFDDVITTDLKGSKLIIENLVDDKVFANLVKRIDTLFNEYIAEKNNGILPKFKHYELIYNFDRTLKFYNVTDYELASAYHNLKVNKNVLFYSYTFGVETYIGIIPNTYKDRLVTEGIITEKNFIDYDTQTWVDNLYDNQIRN